MKVESLVNIIGADFYTGVPDSQLKALCNYLINTYGIDPRHHMIAANEGNCTALAAGYHIATGKSPVVYMQNSGEGNIVNPVASLLNDMVYAIPVIFIVGWRGEPRIHDEPQHVYQGKVTIKLLEDMSIKPFINRPQTTDGVLKAAILDVQDHLVAGKCCAFVAKKGAISYDGKTEYKNNNTMLRETIIQHIVKVSGEDPIISTTGKASRELFEVPEANGQKHKYDFLTVGSMGHSSSIALGIALNKPNTKIWCVDGDGAVLMHMGAMAVIGNNRPNNMIHIVINNEAHETVGGMPTVAGGIDMVTIAKSCGYPYAVSVSTSKSLDSELETAKKRNMLSFIEVKSAIGARDDLGRPTTTSLENKQNFMEYLETLN